MIGKKRGFSLIVFSILFQLGIVFAQGFGFGYNTNQGTTLYYTISNVLDMMLGGIVGAIFDSIAFNNFETSVKLCLWIILFLIYSYLLRGYFSNTDERSSNKSAKVIAAILALLSVVFIPSRLLDIVFRDLLGGLLGYLLVLCVVIFPLRLLQRVPKNDRMTNVLAAIGFLFMLIIFDYLNEQLVYAFDYGIMQNIATLTMTFGIIIAFAMMVYRIILAFGGLGGGTQQQTGPNFWQRIFNPGSGNPTPGTGGNQQQAQQQNPQGPGGNQQQNPQNQRGNRPGRQNQRRNRQNTQQQNPRNPNPQQNTGENEVRLAGRDVLDRVSDMLNGLNSMGGNSTQLAFNLASNNRIVDFFNPQNIYDLEMAMGNLSNILTSVRGTNQGTASQMNQTLGQIHQAYWQVFANLAQNWGLLQNNITRCRNNSGAFNAMTPDFNVFRNWFHDPHQRPMKSLMDSLEADLRVMETALNVLRNLSWQAIQFR